MMKIELNRWKMGFIAALIISAGTGWFVYSRLQAEANAEPAVTVRSAADQKLVDTIMNAPERLDASVTVSDGSHSPVVNSIADPVVELSRRRLLSEVERPELTPTRREPVAAENLYFWKDYASLRKPEIRDPNSPENREGVGALMKARQCRLGQVEQ